jgi:hypothetical protein
MNQPRFVAISSSVLRHGGIVSLALSLFTAQSQIAKPAHQNNSNSGKRQHVATLRSSDSQEGSRVAISSDQSLNNYEAYRRRSLLREDTCRSVARAEALRGRGFADVTAQRSGDSTVLSFRLQPGATAHVEQRANKLDVVVTVPGGSPGVASRSNPLDSGRNTETVNRNAPKNANGNNARTSSLAPLQSNLNSNRKPRPLSQRLPGATPTPIPRVTRTSATPTPSRSASPLRDRRQSIADSPATAATNATL